MIEQITEIPLAQRLLHLDPQRLRTARYRRSASQQEVGERGKGPRREPGITGGGGNHRILRTSSYASLVVKVSPTPEGPALPGLMTVLTTTLVWGYSPFTANYITTHITCLEVATTTGLSPRKTREEAAHYVGNPLMGWYPSHQTVSQVEPTLELS